MRAPGECSVIKQSLQGKKDNSTNYAKAPAVVGLDTQIALGRRNSSVDGSSGATFVDTARSCLVDIFEKKCGIIQPKSPQFRLPKKPGDPHYLKFLKRQSNTDLLKMEEVLNDRIELIVQYLAEDLMLPDCPSDLKRLARHDAGIDLVKAEVVQRLEKGKLTQEKIHYIKDEIQEARRVRHNPYQDGSSGPKFAAHFDDAPSKPLNGSTQPDSIQQQPPDSHLQFLKKKSNQELLKREALLTDKINLMEQYFPGKSMSTCPEYLPYLERLGRYKAERDLVTSELDLRERKKKLSPMKLRRLHDMIAEAVADIYTWPK